ncbi:MAG: RDD family protein [Lautropia sp.]|nr:RDD family protein [Lautropia sp.]
MIPATSVATTWRRLMCVVYEAIILFGVTFFFGYAFSALTQFTGAEGWLRTAFQTFMFVVLGAYFSWFWSNGRWSLPMKTICVKLVRAPGRPDGQLRSLPAGSGAGYHGKHLPPCHSGSQRRDSPGLDDDPNGAASAPVSTMASGHEPSDSRATTAPATPLILPAVSFGRAAWRYTLASIMFWGGLALVWKASPWWLPVFFLPFFWSVFDRQRRTLYDVLAGTVLITCENRTPKRARQPEPTGQSSGGS